MTSICRFFVLSYSVLNYSALPKFYSARLRYELCLWLLNSLPIQSTLAHSPLLYRTRLHSSTFPSTAIHLTPIHFTPIHYIPLHSVPLHSSLLNSTLFIPVNHTLFCPAVCSISFNYALPLQSSPLHSNSITLHFTALHFTSLYCTSLNYAPLHSFHSTVTNSNVHHSTLINSLR